MKRHIQPALNAGELIDLLEDGLLVVDRNLEIRVRNEPAHHQFGFHQSASNIATAVAPDALSGWQSIVERASRERTFRTTLSGPGGNPIRVYSCARPDETFLLTLRKPQPRLEQEPLLEAYTEVLAQYGIGLWNIDMSTGELWWSPKCYELLDMPPGPVSTATYLEKLSEEDQANIGEQIHLAMTGTGEYSPCFKVEGEDGVRFLQDRAHLLSAEAGHMGPLCVGATRDRTREAELEARCAELQASLNETEAVRATSQLAGAVAHDLNNVMTAILGNAELLGLKSQDGRFAEQLDAIGVAARHASALAGRMLDFVRKRPLARKSLDLTRLTAENLNFLRSLVPESVELKLHNKTDSALVSGDRHRMEQVLYNLILNAGQAALGDGGQVTVTVDAASEEIVLSIEDNGKGMSEEQLEQVFEPFYTTRVGGAGLGLSSVRQIVQHHDGTISVTSEPGAGSRFEIRLPQIDADTLQSQADTSRSFSTGLKIWIAEDDNMVRVVLERLLLGAGHQISTFARPTELLSRMDESSQLPDLVITDVIMPEMSGVELYEQIQTRDSQLRVLFMSGYTDQDLNAFRHHIEVGNLLHKPFKRQDLFDAIEDIMQRPPGGHLKAANL